MIVKFQRVGAPFIVGIYQLCHRWAVAEAVHLADKAALPHLVICLVHIEEYDCCDILYVESNSTSYEISSACFSQNQTACREEFLLLQSYRSVLSCSHKVSRVIDLL